MTPESRGKKMYVCMSEEQIATNIFYLKIRTKDQIIGPTTVRWRETARKEKWEASFEKNSL